ncbi:MAG: MarR family transcriptional regulator [Planctomycetes bacterium]|nr:MarR family transcriptional regulator [Planctomycetota bacterium]
MQPSDAKAKQLRESIRDVIRQFRCSDTALANQPHGEISFPEVHIIEFLGDRKPCMMRELAEYLLVAVNTVTSIVDKLEQKQLVRRERDETDRRIVMVQLTDKGREAYQGILEARLNACRAMLTPLNEDEQDIFMVLMRKIAREGSATNG